MSTLKIPDGIGGWKRAVIGPRGEIGQTGAQGQTGAEGPMGPSGSDGLGVPIGGTIGQVLLKASNTDGDTSWSDAPAGGGLTVVGSFSVYVGTGSGCSSLYSVVPGVAGVAEPPAGHPGAPGALGLTWYTYYATGSGYSLGAIEADNWNFDGAVPGSIFINGPCVALISIPRLSLTHSDSSQNIPNGVAGRAYGWLDAYSISGDYIDSPALGTRFQVTNQGMWKLGAMTLSVPLGETYCIDASFGVGSWDYLYDVDYSSSPPFTFQGGLSVSVVILGEP